MVKNFSSSRGKVRTDNFGILYDLVFRFLTGAVATSICLQQTFFNNQKESLTHRAMAWAGGRIQRSKVGSHMDCFGMAAFRQLDLTAATLATHLSMCVCFFGSHGFLRA